MRGKRAITRARPLSTSIDLPSGFAAATIRSVGFSFDFALVAMPRNMQRRSLTIKERVAAPPSSLKDALMQRPEML